MKFYLCQHCKNLVEMIHESGVPMVCCGEKMTELIPNSTDAAGEKHVPVLKVESAKVTVEIGSVEHPMLDVHYIEWIVVETCCGVYRKNLKPGEAPKASFTLGEGETVLAAYAYCNIHGLWMTKA